MDDLLARRRHHPESLPLCLWLAVIALGLPVFTWLPHGLLADAALWVIFPHAAVSLASLILIIGTLCHRGGQLGVRIHPLAAVALAAMFAINVGHFLTEGSQRLSDLAFGLTWLSLPLAAWLHGRRLSSLLPGFITLLWLVNALHGLWQMGHGMEVVGLAGNRNWHGIFVVATTPVVLWHLGNRLAGMARRARLTTLVVVAAYALLLLYHSHSRGAWLSLVVVGFMAAWQQLPAWRKRLAVGAVVVVLLGALTAMMLGEETAAIIFADVRLPLWRGALGLTSANPWFGVSHAGFENAYYEHIPAEYFLRSYATMRSNHPHHHLLYMAGCLGWAGMIAWLCLWGGALWFFFRRYARLPAMIRILGWCYLALLLHSCLDLALFQWPTLEIAALYLGVMWHYGTSEGEVVSVAPDDPRPAATVTLSRRRSPAFNWLLAAVAILLGICFLRETADNIRVSYWRQFTAHYRRAGRPAYALHGGVREVSVRPGAAALVGVAELLLREFDDPAMALAYLEKLEETPDRTYATSHHLTGQCLLRLGRKWPALAEFRRDAAIFPLSLISLNNLWQLERELGLDEDARQTAARLEWAMAMKGLQPEDLPAIFADPALDLGFHRYHAVKDAPAP